MNTKTMIIKSLGSLFDLCPQQAKEGKAFETVVHLNLEYDLCADDISSHWADVSGHMGSAFLDLTHTDDEQKLLASAKRRCINSTSDDHLLNLSKSITIEMIEGYWLKDKAPESCSTITKHQEKNFEINYDR
ncbi:hypothetical protein AB6D86_25320 [Vibrio splendidus]